MQAVIKLAITRSGADYELMESPVPMTQARVVRELADRSGRIDLCWTMTSIEREARLLPVRVPMDRGLIGCRVAFVRPEDVDRWRDLHDLNELSRYVAGQGQDWPDTAILRANGLPVQGISRYEALFDMLRMRRIDYFPRAVFEIDDEAATPAAHDLVIEPHVLLRYPAASYLFVRPDRPRLAAELQRGMEAAASDGSLARLFQQYFGDLLRRHHLARRRQLLLKNPLLPPETPLHKPAYWLVIEG
ncbi:hypothetical protein ASC91_23940 [Pelomonas sp. Root1237]|nr:hypothetical protein ASC91_23940 [Pelomonas sp. Root1237]